MTYDVDALTSKLKDAVTQASASFYRLVILTDRQQRMSGKQLQIIADSAGFGLMNVGVQLASQLRYLSVRHRKLRVSDMLQDMVEQFEQTCVILYRTEILFEPALTIRPLAAVERIARDRTLILYWPGELDDGRLTFSEPGRSDYFSCAASDYLVVEKTN